MLDGASVGQRAYVPSKWAKRRREHPHRWNRRAEVLE
jgi:hypothetical protein